MNTQSELKARLGVTLFCLGLTLLVSLPFFFIGEVPNSGCCGGAMPVTHDSAMHFNQMQSFRRGLAAGRIYPRWDDLTHDGYGAPTTSFYPPGVYYLTSFFYATLRDWLHTLIALHLVMTAASGAAIYLYARQTMSRIASLVAMSVYLIAPYHLINQYQRGAIAEQLSFIWAPLMLLFAERLLQGSKRLLNFTGLAASFGAFLWSHPPTAYQFTLVFGLCLGGEGAWSMASKSNRTRMKQNKTTENTENTERKVMKPNDDGLPQKSPCSPCSPWFIPLTRYRLFRFRGINAVTALACALLFGSMLAAAYFYPAIAEQHLINADDIEKTWPYHSSYVFDFTQTVYNHNDDFFARLDRIWVFSMIAIVVAALVLLIFKRFSSGSVWIWVSAGALASFLMTGFSYPIGRFIPKIEIGVFSWRMLSITSLVVALLAGACWRAAIDSVAMRKIVYGAASIAILIGAIAMSGWYVVKPVYRGEAFKPIPEHYNYATLPRGVPREVPEMEQAQLASGAERIAIEEWRPEFRRLRIVLDNADRLHIRTSNFPGWTAFVDGKRSEIKNGDVGNIVIDLSPGEHQVALDFRSTPIRRASNWITFISIAFLISLFVIAGRRRR